MSEFNGGITADINEVHVAGHIEDEDGLKVTRCRCHGDVLEKLDPNSERATWLVKGQSACYGGTAFMAVPRNCRGICRRHGGRTMNGPVELSAAERRTIEQMRDVGKRRTVGGVSEVLVFTPLSWWVAADDVVSGGHRIGALIEDKLCPVAWDDEEMGRGVADEHLRTMPMTQRKSLKALLFGWRGRR